MKRTIIILATMTALSFMGLAQDDDAKYDTGGRCNGRFWLAMSAEQQIGYLLGYGDHWKITAEALSKTNDFTNELIAVPRLTNDETAKGLDAFYADTANVNITIRDALFILAGKVMGLSANDLQRLTEMARKAAANSAK